LRARHYGWTDETLFCGDPPQRAPLPRTLGFSLAIAAATRCCLYVIIRRGQFN
jgi:hypothetical protein